MEQMNITACAAGTTALYTDQVALYSGEREKLLQAFAGTYTLCQNGELYPIYWFERHNR